MPIDENYLEFPYPFKHEDICGSLDIDAFHAELGKAFNRAKWVMLTDCEQFSGTWGIEELDYIDDVSGKLQVALQLLTAYEFLRLHNGLLESTIRLVGMYRSPTGETIEKGQASIDAFNNFLNKLYEDAYNSAYPWIKCKDVPGLIVARAYDWEALEKEYFTDRKCKTDPKWWLI